MKDIETLRKIAHPHTWIQLRIFLIACSIGSAVASQYYMDAPVFFSAFLAIFFLLPLCFGTEQVLKTITMAIEAYDSHASVGGSAQWQESDSDNASWDVKLDLNDHGRWTVKLAGGERPVSRAKENLPAPVTVWLHPETREPRLLKSELGYFYAKSLSKTE